MQVKSEVFFSFRKLGRLLFGEPLGGVGAPTPCRGGAPRAETFLPWTRLEELSSPRGPARSRSRVEPKRRECVRAYC